MGALVVAGGDVNAGCSGGESPLWRFAQRAHGPWLAGRLRELLRAPGLDLGPHSKARDAIGGPTRRPGWAHVCLLYTPDAAEALPRLGCSGRPLVSTLTLDKICDTRHENIK